MQSPRFPMRFYHVAPVLLGLLAACTLTAPGGPRGILPATRWDHRPEASEWTQATLAALEAEGAVLVSSVPSDVEAYCPGYAAAPPARRKAFWVGLLSAVAGVESRWNPGAVGGGGAYKGLMQISDGTAAQNGCATGAALYDGGENLACAVRIVSGHVARDAAIFGGTGQGWRGIARDWIPFRRKEVRSDLAAWTAAQSYCR